MQLAFNSYSDGELFKSKMMMQLFVGGGSLKNEEERRRVKVPGMTCRWRNFAWKHMHVKNAMLQVIQSFSFVNKNVKKEIAQKSDL